MSDKATPEEGERPRLDDEDVEGHSLSMAIGLGQLGKPPGKDRSRPPQKDEELPPLTKSFPRMRDDRKR